MSVLDSNATQPPEATPQRARVPFPSTSWSTISAARGSDEARARDGLQYLGEKYWKPLYAYLRKCGESHEDASDSVQSFFEFVLQGDFLSYVRRDAGRFRSFLLKSLDRWRSRQRVRDGAQKRGGDAYHVSLDGIEELRRRLSHDDGLSATQAYDKQWAINLSHIALAQVRKDYVGRGRESWFEALRGALPGGEPLVPYVKLAKQLDSSEGAIKKAVHDLRHAFAAQLRAEIRTTVRTAEEAEDELHYLMSLMVS